MNMYKPLLDKLDILEPLLDVTADSKLMEKAKFLYDRIANPESYVVFLGETSSGKSSLINGFIKEHLLPVKASPSTASIAEIVLKSELAQKEFFSVSKSAKMKRLSVEEFQNQCEHPSEELNRLRVHVPSMSPQFNNLRIFDTPGYGAIIEKHEEILMDFIPSSDVVIYTVSYKVGIQNYDYSFLGFLKELLRKDAQVILMINRCPTGIDLSSNSRVKEITSYVSDLLTIDPQVFLVENTPVTDESGHALPQCDELWQYVSRVINQEDRKRTLYEVFDQHIRNLYNECDNIIQIRYKEAFLTDNELRDIRISKRKFAAEIRAAADEIVQPAFQNIKNKIPKLIDDAETGINSSIIEKIEESDRLDKDEMVAFTNSHLLPFSIKKEMNEVIKYLDVELTDLNDRLYDYIQKEVIKFTDKIEIIIESNFDKAVKSIAQEYIKKVMNSTLSSYLLRYAGAAGLRGGAANAASHGLKVFGDLFKKTFSKHTHEMVQKVAASAAKGIGAAIAVVTELIFEAYDILTWKKNLKKKVKLGVTDWKQDTLAMLFKDIDKLEETNITTLFEIAKEIDDNVVATPSSNIDEIKKQVLLSESIGKQLNYCN